MRIKHKTRRPARKGGKRKGRGKTIKGGFYLFNESFKDIYDYATEHTSAEFDEKYPDKKLIDIFGKKYSHDEGKKYCRNLEDLQLNIRIKESLKIRGENENKIYERNIDDHIANLEKINNSIIQVSLTLPPELTNDCKNKMEESEKKVEAIRAKWQRKKEEEAARRELEQQSRPPFNFESYNANRASEEYAAARASNDNDYYGGGNKKKHLKKSRRLIKKSKTIKGKTRQTRK